MVRQMRQEGMLCDGTVVRGLTSQWCGWITPLRLPATVGGRGTAGGVLRRMPVSEDRRYGVVMGAQSGRSARADGGVVAGAQKGGQGFVQLSYGQQEGMSGGGTSVVIPLSYAHVLGLKGRDLYLDPVIANAYDDLFHQQMHPGYSAIAKLGKEKLLFAAREGLRNVKGRVSLLHPDVTIEPVLLPGAMALLNQVQHYELVVQLGERSKNISNRDLKATNKGTIRDYRRDVCLASALANCGLAKDALEAGAVSLGYARLEEALSKLDDAPGGGKSLAPELYDDISRALVDMRSDAIVDTLKEPLDLSQVTNRKAAINTFVEALKPGNAVTHDFVTRLLSFLTSEEIVEMMDWTRVAPSQSTWCTADILSYVGLAHMVAGFSKRKPYFVSKARRIFGIARENQADVAIPLAVSEVLLGETKRAVGILEEDERLGLKLRGAARMDTSHQKKMPADHLPNRDDVMAFIRHHSQSTGDVLPGLCLFVELWLAQVAFPRIRDSKEHSVSPSLSAYFEAPGTVKYLTSKSLTSDSIILSTISRLFGVLSSTPQQVGRLVMRALVNVSNAPSTLKIHKSISLVGVVAIAMWGGYRLLMGTSSKPLYDSVSTSTLPVTGESLSKQKSSKSKTTKKKANSIRKESNRKEKMTASDPSIAVGLTRQEAKQLVETWLEIKAQAMGPRHSTARLDSVLTDPMLHAVTTEAIEAAKSGWFWNIRPLKVRIESMSSERTMGEENAPLTVEAIVDESADLWASNGKKGDSYRTSYRVEYTVVKMNSEWKISSALVVGK